MFKRLVKKVLRSVFQGQFNEVVQSQVGAVSDRINYLDFEVSNINRMLRELAADRDIQSRSASQTTSSFDYQWKNLPSDRDLLSNPEFRATVSKNVCQFQGLSEDWFKGKRVLDAGCGNGRFSYGMAMMGAQVTAFDFSEGGVANLQREAKEASLSIDIFRHNILQPLPITEQLDLVWSFGVLHHTGNTHRAFVNIAPHVKDDGLMFLMIYGEPRQNHPEDYTELYHYERLRRKVRNLSFEDAIQVLREDPIVESDKVHGWFDAVSPFINDLHSFEELSGWLRHAGFVDIHKTLESRNLFIVARKAAVTAAS